MTTRTLLLELGCEELPSSCLRQLGVDLHSAITTRLRETGLGFGASRWFASPRRLAVLIEELDEQAPDVSREALGPPLAQAKDEDGNWTRAATGFAARHELSPEELQVIDTPKGQRLGLQQVVPGARTTECLLELVSQGVESLPIPKRMRWGASRTEFARPVHWVVLVYGHETGFGTVLGIESGRHTRGHRFHAPQAIEIDRAERYPALLREARVVADFDERCSMIREQVETTAAGLDARALIDADLLEEVASLVEWPVALAGSFDDAFLRIPAEALISSMQSHQKYFPVVGADGELRASFITVSNIESRDPQQVVAGNERVIRPRLADAAFFFEQDCQQSLASRVERLGGVVFQKQLGTVLDKTRRIQRLAGELAARIGASREQAERAAELCKADLVSEMVLEFADMQGIAGAYYARNDGEDDVVADAVAQHYWPTQAGGELPQSDVAVAVALADRLDTLLGIFGIGQPPSGSRDPFALRRASIAVLRIIIEKSLALDLRDCLALAAAGYAENVIAADSEAAVLDYVLDRMPALYEDEKLPVEVFRAVRAAGCSAPMEFDRRLRAVQAFMARPEAEALAAANKRVANILAKAGREDTSRVSADLLQEPEEKELYERIAALAAGNRELIASADYGTALAQLATLREPVDAFFDGVMVNAEDPQLRANRLALLAGLRNEFLAIADISQLASTRS